MKKRICLLISVFLLFPVFVYAKGSASISGPSTVESGSKVTISVTLKNVAAWDIEINSSGSTSGCSDHFVSDSRNGKDTTKTLSVTCKATSVGSIGFTASGDITSADGDNKSVSLSKRVTVTNPRPKSTDDTLASITIEGYTLTPEFNKDTLEYSVTVPSTVNSVKIDAKANESHATVSGTGELEVSEGVNTFEIVCTAETGVKKTYVVLVNVEDINPINVKIGEEDFTIVKNAKNLTKPESYEEKTIEIDGNSIPAFYSDVTHFTLIGVKNSIGTINLAIYNEENNTYKLYNEINQSTLTLYLIDFENNLEGYVKKDIVINDVQVPVYAYNEDSRFVICYGMDIHTGKYDYYEYDTKEGTFQVWDHEEIDSLKQQVKTYTYICFAFGGCLFLAFILILSLLKKKKKTSKKEEAKESTKKENKKLKEFDKFE